MSQFSFDLDNLVTQVTNRNFFDLSTPDPEFPDFIVRPEAQLPGRPQEGKIEIGRFFQCLTLFVTDKQQEEACVEGVTIYDYLKLHRLPVLGPNVGQYLYEHRDLIPKELRGKVALVFWGKVYCDSDGSRCVRYLIWGGDEWFWDHFWIDDENWSAYDQAVLLASQPSAL